MKKNRFR